MDKGIEAPIFLLKLKTKFDFVASIYDWATELSGVIYQKSFLSIICKINDKNSLFFLLFLLETLTTKTFISAISVKEKQNKCAFKIKTKGNVY